MRLIRSATIVGAVLVASLTVPIGGISGVDTAQAGCEPGTRSYRFCDVPK